MVSLLGLMMMLIAWVGIAGRIVAIQVARDPFAQRKVFAALSWGGIVSFAGMLIFIAGRVFRHWLP